MFVSFGFVFNPNQGGLLCRSIKWGDQNGTSLLHSGYLILALLDFQFLDFQIRSFVDPKPVELRESVIPLKLSPSLLV